MVASQLSPSRSRLWASYSNVENVVYDPVKPTATSSRKSSARSQPSSCNTRRSESTAENQPRNNDPLTLMNSVPHGNAVPQARPKATPRPQRASPPATEPADTKAICMSKRTASSRQQKTPPELPSRQGLVYAARGPSAALIWAANQTAAP